MAKATEELTKDHKMIRKTLEGFDLGNPRFSHITKTLHRLVVGHAWFEDHVFLPVFEAEPLLQKRFLEEIYQEHKDIDQLLKLIRRTPVTNREDLEAFTLQLRVLLETHFSKEEDALFPVAEKILGDRGMIQLGEEMRRRQREVLEIPQE
jgi:hypothetical protein